jgi:hypothetical protein
MSERRQHGVLGAVCALVIGVYAWSAQSGWLEVWSVHAQTTYYNLMVRGFQAGQLNLKRAVPFGLANSANPYEPKTMTPYLAGQYPLHDLSYYQEGVRKFGERFAEKS